MPNIVLELPNYTSSNLEEAINVINGCRKDALPDFDFPYSYISPGGAYGGMWWQLDYSLAMAGLQWFDFDFALQGIKNFASCQKEDGRIPLWGNDRLPQYSGERLQREQTSSLPKLFDAVSRILRQSQDEELLNTGYSLMKRYLDWWINKRYDESTGLFSAVFEETFIPYFGFAGEYAPVDLNMEILHSFYSVADLASRLGKNDDATLLRNKGHHLKKSINTLLWNDAHHFFFPLQLQSKTHLPLRMASAFATLRYNTATPNQISTLIDAITSTEHFNWNIRGITSVDKCDKAFTLVSGNYNGNPSWSGSVWTLTNENAIRGLKDCGQKQLAAQLLIHTLDLFKTQYCEFINPETGEPCGVKDYAWTAATCIDLIFSILLGIDYDATTNKITVTPTLPSSWNNQTLHLQNLALPDTSILNLDIICKNTPLISAERIIADGTKINVQGNSTITLS